LKNKNKHLFVKKLIFTKKIITLATSWHKSMLQLYLKKYNFMKKVLLITFSYLAVSSAVAQSDKQLTHYMFDKMSYNPAITGLKGYCGTAIYRGQWDKVENAPNTMLINVQGNLPNVLEGSGIGLSIMSDVIGLGKELEVKLNYAYHHQIAGYGLLSAGVGVGIENIGFDPKWVPPNGAPSLDPNLPTGAGQTALDFNFGLHFKGNEGYFVGLSATHLSQPNLANVSFTKARHYYVLAGYKIQPAKDTWAFFLPQTMTVTPSVLFKTDAVAGILDFNILADMWLNGSNAGFYGGLTYRTKDAIAIMVGFQMRKFDKTGTRGTLGSTEADVIKVGYSYDVMTNPLNQYGSGSHEIVFNYCMFKPAPKVARYGNVFILQ